MPCPTSRNLENKFYPNAKDIIKLVEKFLKETLTQIKLIFIHTRRNLKGLFNER